MNAFLNHVAQTEFAITMAAQTNASYKVWESGFLTPLGELTTQ